MDEGLDRVESVGLTAQQSRGPGCHKVAPVSSSAFEEDSCGVLVNDTEKAEEQKGTRSDCQGVVLAKPGDGGRPGRRRSGLMLLELDASGTIIQTAHPRFWSTWFQRKVASFVFVSFFCMMIVPLTLGFAWIVNILANQTGSGSASDSDTSVWFGHGLVKCTSQGLERDAWLLFFYVSAVLYASLSSLVIFQVHFFMSRSVWLHTLGGLVVVIMAGLLVVRTTFRSISVAGLVAFFYLYLFLGNLVGRISRRVAQYRYSKHKNKRKYFIKNVQQETVVAFVTATMIMMSGLYLIASERTSGALDILINGILYPALCATFRALLHKINQDALHRKTNQDHDRLMDVAGITSSMIVS